MFETNAHCSIEMKNSSRLFIQYNQSFAFIHFFFLIPIVHNIDTFWDNEETTSVYTKHMQDMAFPMSRGWVTRKSSPFLPKKRLKVVKNDVANSNGKCDLSLILFQSLSFFSLRPKVKAGTLRNRGWKKKMEKERWYRDIGQIHSMMGKWLLFFFWLSHYSVNEIYRATGSR